MLSEQEVRNIGGIGNGSEVKNRMGLNNSMAYKLTSPRGLSIMFHRAFYA